MRMLTGFLIFFVNKLVSMITEDGIGVPPIHRQKVLVVFPSAVSSFGGLPVRLRLRRVHPRWRNLHPDSWQNNFDRLFGRAGEIFPWTRKFPSASSTAPRNTPRRFLPLENSGDSVATSWVGAEPVLIALLWVSPAMIVVKL